MWAPNAFFTKSRQPLASTQGFELLYNSKKSRVWRCVDTTKGETVVLKAYFKALLSPSEKVKSDRELRLFSKLLHPNIIRVLATFEACLPRSAATSSRSAADLCTASDTVPKPAGPELPVPHPRVCLSRRPVRRESLVSSRGFRTPHSASPPPHCDCRWPPVSRCVACRSGQSPRK